MLEIKNLKASINDKIILKGLNLSIKPGEVHAIMGPNGSGKSTLANVLSGKSGYEITGELNFQGEDLKEVPVEERAQKGIFLAFQYPLEIPGVNTNNFLKTSLNSVLKSKGKKELDTLSFLKLVKEKSSELGIDEKFLFTISLKSENFQSSCLLFGNPVDLKRSKFFILKFLSSLVIFNLSISLELISKF